jgi:hypothetical protein
VSDSRAFTTLLESCSVAQTSSIRAEEKAVSEGLIKSRLLTTIIEVIFSEGLSHTQVVGE